MKNCGKKLLVIVNPASGKGISGHTPDDIARAFVKYGFEPAVRVTGGGEDAEKFAMDCAGYDLIVCRGGDGTLNEVVSGLMKAGIKKPVGYIPAGTTNDFAHSMKIPLDLEENVRLIANMRAKPIDIGQFNDKYFVYTSAFGIFTRCSYKTGHKMKKLFGHSAYILSAISELKEYKVFRADVVCDGKDYSGEYVFGSVSNSLSVGGTMKFKREFVGFNDGLFELTLVKKIPSAWKIPPLVSCVAKSKFDPEYITLVQGRNIRIEFEEDVPWSLDGEYGGAYKVNEISCHRSALEIFTND